MSHTASFDWKFEQKIIPIHKPIAIVALKAKRGSWKQFTFTIDSGADMTGMNSCDCESLGYNLKDGSKIEFSGIGGQQIGYMHKIDLSINGNILPRAPIVFVEKRISELLLGREGVFDKYDILFSKKDLQTHFFEALDMASRL